jgi:FkbM family methyltransferase
MDYELIVQKVYESILENGDIAIDVGAHVGRHTIPIARKIAPNGKVFACEPLPMCQSPLLNSIKTNPLNLNGIVTVYPYALSDFEGISDFTIVVDDIGYSGLKERKIDNNSRIEKIKVNVKKLDNLFSKINSLRYIKIDAEGGEFNILKGGIYTIKKFRPVVTFEFGASSYSAYSVIPEQVFIFWNELNYKIYDILGNLLDGETIFAQSSINQHVWDYIAIPADNISATEEILRAIIFQ